MQHKSMSRKCNCRRLPATWLCTFPGCDMTFFCKKCRRDHNSEHEKYSYPIMELLEDDADLINENMELLPEELKTIYQKIDDEIESTQDRFEEDMKRVRKTLRENILKFHLHQSMNPAVNKLDECRQKVRENPLDSDLLRRLGHEYHRYIHESKIQAQDKAGFIRKIRDDIEHRFDFFNFDLDSIINLLRKSQRYPDKALQTRRKSRPKEASRESRRSRPRGSKRSKDTSKEHSSRPRDNSFEIKKTGSDTAKRDEVEMESDVQIREEREPSREEEATERANEPSKPV